MKGSQFRRHSPTTKHKANLILCLCLFFPFSYRAFYYAEFKSKAITQDVMELYDEEMFDGFRGKGTLELEVICKKVLF